jgi:8-oxo-dGTP pyrophosphatase MutT (NUDIX family)
VRLPVPIRRLGFRVAHRLLRIWWFIRRPQQHGVKCVLTDGENVLLVQHTYGKREWDLPGGGIKRDERPLDAARREIEEELGIRLDSWRDLGHLGSPEYHRHATIYCFQAEVNGKPLTIERAEIDTVRWFSRRRLPRDSGRFVKRVVALLG